MEGRGWVVKRKSQIALVVAISLVAGSLALFGAGAVAQPGKGGGQPANKVVAGGSTLESTGANETPIPILSQRMRVSSPADLMLHVTAECSILTGLVTGEEGVSGDSATSESNVELWIEIDGNKVPVSTAGDDDPEEPRGDEHKVVFCNREYSRTVTDREEDGAIDEQRDYIRTRSANAFNWFALDTGFDYDSPHNGQNILDVVLWAEFTRDPDTPCAGEEDEDPFPFVTCAEAFVGNRTLIIEPTHAAVGEQVEPMPAEEEEIGGE